MALRDDSPDDRTNRSRGAWLGLAIGLGLAILVDLDAFRRRGSALALIVPGSLAFVAATAWNGGRAGVATGRLPAGSGARFRYGLVPAWLSLAMLMLLAGGSDVAEGRRKLSELPVSVLAGLFFGSIPALLVGAVVGIVLSSMVTPSAARLPAAPSRDGAGRKS
jgi:hypothetical protein